MPTQNAENEHKYPGREPSESTYVQGCRCSDCKKEHVKRSAVHGKARLLAAQWVRKYRADVWERCMDEAYNYYGLERQPVGRPPAEDSWMKDYNDY